LICIPRNTVKMDSNIYPWHKKNWRTLQGMGNKIPHALLLHGPEGTGIVDFANFFAKSMLCEDRTEDGNACGKCESCHWFDQNSHPDFKKLSPESMDGEQSSENTISEESDSKKSKSPSKKIPIEAIRQLNGYANITTHRGGLRVMLIYPVESMTQEASNALLKILEEPPANTLFLLVSSHIGTLLPTILSRCSKLAFPLPTLKESLDWLSMHQVNDAERWLAEQGGAPLLAKEAAEQEMNGAEHALFLQQLCSLSDQSLLKTAEQLQKVPIRQIVLWYQRWLYDLLSQNLTGSVRYYPIHCKSIEKLARIINRRKLLEVIKQATERKKRADHPLVPRLVLEDMLLEYNQIFK